MARPKKNVIAMTERLNLRLTPNQHRYLANTSKLISVSEADLVRMLIDDAIAKSMPSANTKVLQHS